MDPKMSKTLWGLHLQHVYNFLLVQIFIIYSTYQIYPMAPALHSLHLLPFRSPFLSKHSNLPTFLPFLSIFLENINFSSNPPEILSQVLVRTLSVVDYGERNKEFGGHEEMSNSPRFVTGKIFQPKKV
ncbi:hypothetical protein Ddye_013628 [Dipteronia dyeriana]|uniref:Uncharacterized protein n=1 Tax=Dipteronia dyeriana TaxID=168575 RepID=A0AAE0CJS7_9ROSI|nr:hypothetical protein Ddye_013628 [Dipteronia dyeriana]